MKDNAMDALGLALARISRAADRAAVMSQKTARETQPGASNLLAALAGSRQVMTSRLRLLRRGKITAKGADVKVQALAEARELLAVVKDLVELAGQQGLRTAVLEQAVVVEERICELLSGEGDASADTYLVCQICGYVAGAEAPQNCPVCGAVTQKFQATEKT